MAGSCGRALVAFGGSQTVRSLISLPRKMMYSKTSSRGGIGLSVGRSSVPKERTVGKTHRLTYTTLLLLLIKEENLLALRTNTVDFTLTFNVRTEYYELALE